MAKFLSKTYGEKNRKVVFILSGWAVKQWMMAIPAILLSRKGFQCIVYTYDGGSLSGDLQTVVDEFFEVRNGILTHIERLKNHGLGEFSVLGTSLGTIPALLVANSSRDISKIIINTTGSDLIEAIWGWKGRMGWVKDEFMKLGYTQEKLQSLWSVVMPENNIDNLRNKKILFFYAQKDGLIPLRFSEDLASKLTRKKYSLQISVNKHLGHFLAGTVNLLKSKYIADFLNSDY